MKNKIPGFKNEAEERKFWQEHDSEDYIDWSAADTVDMPQLKPSTKKISIRLPESMIDNLKVLANKRDVPYQSLVKMFLAEKIDAEFKA